MNVIVVHCKTEKSQINQKITSIYKRANQIIEKINSIVFQNVMNSSTFLIMYVYEYIIHTLNYKNFKNTNGCLHTNLPNPSSYMTPLSSNSTSHPLSLVPFWGLTQLLPSLTFSILIPHTIFTLKFPVFHKLSVK